MAPKKPNGAPILNEGQISLLVHVAKHSQSSLSTSDWDKIAVSMGISNGRAAKERFRYLMAQLKDGDDADKDTNGDDTKAPKGPSKLPKKRAAGASGKKGGSVKKAKTSSSDVAEADEDAVQNGDANADIGQESEA